jgi:hypothetical protein
LNATFKTTDGFTLSLFFHNNEIKWLDSDLMFDSLEDFGLPVGEEGDLLDGEVNIYLPMALSINDKPYLVQATFTATYRGGKLEYTPYWSIKYKDDSEKSKISKLVDISIMEESICLFGIFEDGAEGSFQEQEEELHTVRYKLTEPHEKISFMTEYIGQSKT